MSVKTVRAKVTPQLALPGSSVMRRTPYSRIPYAATCRIPALAIMTGIQEVTLGSIVLLQPAENGQDGIRKVG